MFVVRIFNLKIVYMWMFACMCRCTEEGITPGTGGTDGCEPLCGCWASILGPPQEQPML